MVNIIISGPLDMGGAESSFVNAANMYGSARNIFIAESRGALSQLTSNVYYIDEMGIKLKNRNDKSSYEQAYSRLLKSLFKRNKCRKIIEKKFGKIDNLLLYSDNSIPMASLFKRVKRESSGVIFHSNFMMLYSKLQRALYNFFTGVKNYNDLFGVSEIATSTASNFFGRNVAMISNPVDKNSVYMRANEKVYEKFDNYFISIARHAKVKRINLLLKSFNIYCKFGGKYDLVQIGAWEIETESEIRQIINKSNYKERIHFLGQKINPCPYLKNSKALVLTSEYEGQPMVFIEAAILSKRIMSTNVGNIEDYNGSVILTDNPDEIAKNMLKVEQYDDEVSYDLTFLDRFKEVIGKYIW